MEVGKVEAILDGETEFKAKIRGCGKDVYAMAGKAGGSEFARMCDFRLYKLTPQQRLALQRGRENRLLYLDQRRFQAQLVKDVANASGETPSGGTVGRDENRSWSEYSSDRKRKREYITRRKRDEFRLLVDGNFDEGDLFVTLTFTEEQISKAEDIFKGVLKRLREFYAKKLGVPLKYVWVFEYGGTTHRKHVHILINGVDEECRERIKSRISKLWEGYIDIEVIKRQLGVVAAYMSKSFGEDKLLFAKEYDHSKNLIKPVEAVIDIMPEEYYTPLAICRSHGENETWKYFEGLPQMACKRLLNAPYVYDPDDSDNSACISGTIIDVSEEVAAGKIGERRGIADITYFAEECDDELIGMIDDPVLIGSIDEEALIWEPYFQTEKFVRQSYAMTEGGDNFYQN